MPKDVLTGRTTLAGQLQGVMAPRGATEWSKVLDVDRTTIHKWWAGESYPRGRLLEDIARITGTELRFVATQAEEAPAWARALTDEVLARLDAVSGDVEGLLTRGMLGRLEVLLAPLLPPSSEEGGAGGPEPRGGGRGRRRRAETRDTR